MTHTPTQKQLLSSLHYDPASGIFTWTRREGTKTAGDVAGTIDQYGYRCISFKGHIYKAHRLAFIYMEGSIDDDVQVDHKNGIRDDNRWSNIRLATYIENCQNKRVYKTNKTGCPGASYVKSSQKYKLVIKLNNTALYMGRYSTIEECIWARNFATAMLYGEFAKTLWIA